MPQTQARDAAGRGPGAGARSCGKRHDRRPLGRHRGGPECRLQDVFHRLRLRRKAARSLGLSRQVAPGSRRHYSFGFRRFIAKPEDFMNSLDRSRVKIFADGADKAGMLEMYSKPFIKGFTTNPTLMKKAGISDYRGFAKDILKAIVDRPISFEVFSDEFQEMERQAMEIAGWGKNVYVKIPVTNTRREFAGNLIEKLSHAGVKLNVTALLTLEQVHNVVTSLSPDTPACISVFAGRIADTGQDPLPLMTAAVQILKLKPKSELIWASPRELLNIFQAGAIGCHIITVTNDILKKLDLVGRNLSDYSLDTVKMFYKDAKEAGFTL